MIKRTSSNILLLLLTNTLARVEPPTTGKFFYVDFDAFGQWGQHAVNVSVKNKDNSFAEYPLLVSTTEGRLGLISNACKVGEGHEKDAPDCEITTPYQPELSSTFRGNEEAPLRATTAVYNDRDYQTQETLFHGYKAQENFYFTFKDYNREMASRQSFITVTAMKEE